MIEKLYTESMFLILSKVAVKNKAALLCVPAYYMATGCYRSPMSIFKPLKILLLINAIHIDKEQYLQDVPSLESQGTGLLEHLGKSPS